MIIKQSILLLIFNNKQFSTTHPHIPSLKSAFNRSLNAALAGQSPLLYVPGMITPACMHVCLKLIQLTECPIYVYSMYSNCPLLKKGKTTRNCIQVIQN